MKYWIIADTHFDHKNISKWTQRKAGWQDRLLRNLMNTVGPLDIFIHLGDVSFKNHEEWHKILTAKAYKNILILGNHDKCSYTFYYKYWDCVCTRLDMYKFGLNLVLSHKPVQITNNEINVHGHFHDKDLKECFDIEPDLYKIYTPNHCLLKLEGINNVQNLEKLTRKHWSKYHEE